MIKKVLFVAFVVALVVGAVRFFAMQRAGEDPSPSNLPRATVIIGNGSFSVEVADTPALQAQGLSGRASLKKDEGMLFVFSGKAPQTFWMKGMRFPLDFVWIADGKVVGVTENAPADNGLLTYGSPGPVDQVLEINAGEVARQGIQAGQSVTVTIEGIVR